MAFTEAQLSAAGQPYGYPQPKQRINPEDIFYPYFSGFPVPLGSTETVLEKEAYYLHGQAGAGGTAPVDPERARDLGCPISGDQTARFHHWRRGHRFPTYGDVPGLTEPPSVHDPPQAIRRPICEQPPLF